MTIDITHLVAHFPPESYGGMETHVRDLASEQSGYDDLDVTVVTTCPGETGDYSYKFDVRWAARIGEVKKAVVAPSLPLHLYRSDPDLVHVHVPFHGGFETAFLAKLALDVPVVSTIHMYGWDPSTLHKLYTNVFLNPLLRRSDAIVGSTGDYLSEFPIFDRISDRLNVIPHGVDMDRYSPVDQQQCEQFRAENGIPPEARVVLFVGSLDEGHYYKRLDWLLEAMDRVQSDVEDAYLLVVGKGSRRPVFESLAKRLGIEDSVTFTGFLPDDAMPTAYTVADTFVLPSEADLSESFGIVQLEAMACDTPVVATDTPGSRVVGKEAGEVFTPGDIADLADTVAQVLATEYPSPRSVVQGRYDWTSVGQDWYDLYTEVLQP